MATKNGKTTPSAIRKPPPSIPVYHSNNHISVNINANQSVPAQSQTSQTFVPPKYEK